MSFRRAGVLASLFVLPVLALLVQHCGAFSGNDSSGNPPDPDAGDPLVADAGPVNYCGDGSICDCNGTQVDVTAADPANCGACGRTCLPDLLNQQAVCNAGVCVAQPVHTPFPNAGILAAAGDDIYFGDLDPNDSRATVGRALHSTAYVPETLAQRPNVRVHSLAVDGTSVYAVLSHFNAGFGQLLKFPLTGDCDGGCADVIDDTDKGPDAARGNVPLQVAVTDTQVFWTRSPDSNDEGQLMVIAKSGGTATPLDNRRGFNMGQSGFPTLVLDKGFVFAAHDDEGLMGFTNGVFSLPVGPCPAQKTDCLQEVVPRRTRGLAADDRTLYFVSAGVDGGDNYVARRADTDPVDVSYIAGRTGIGNILAVDQRDIYWLEKEVLGVMATWRLLRSGKDGKCPTYAPCPQVVAVESCPDMNADPGCGISAVALGPTQIFYARGGGKGGVYRTPR